ncbi:hypothetical protein Tco_1486057, partial [Tanacetum coccineum]
GVVHGKAGRSLAQLEAYDTEVERKYVDAVSEFENISFPLLDELEGLKDSPLSTIMSALVLKDDHGNVDVAPEFARFQPSLDQVGVPVYSDSGSVDHEMLLSEAIPSVRRSAERRGLCPPPSARTSSSVPPPGSSLDVADYQVLSDDGGSASQPPIVQAHDDLFDTSIWTALVLILDILRAREYISAAVPELVRSLPECLYHFVWPFPFWAQLSAFFSVACLVAAVDEISWTEACAADFRIVVLFHLSFASGLSGPCFLPSFLEDVQYMRHFFNPIFVVFTQPGFYPFSHATVCPFHLVVGLRMFNGCKPLPDIKLLTPVFKRIIPELLSVVKYDFSWKPESTYDVIPYKFLDLAACYCCYRLCFDPLCKVIDGYYQEFHFSLCFWEWA